MYAKVSLTLKVSELKIRLWRLKAATAPSPTHDGAQSPAIPAPGWTNPSGVWCFFLQIFTIAGDRLWKKKQPTKSSSPIQGSFPNACTLRTSLAALPQLREADGSSRRYQRWPSSSPAGTELSWQNSARKESQQTLSLTWLIYTVRREVGFTAPGSITHKHC